MPHATFDRFSIETPKISFPYARSMFAHYESFLETNPSGLGDDGLLIESKVAWPVKISGCGLKASALFAENGIVVFGYDISPTPDKRFLNLCAPGTRHFLFGRREFTVTAPYTPIAVGMKSATQALIDAECVMIALELVGE